MEVKDIGQGRQLSLDINTSSNATEAQDSMSVDNKPLQNKDLSEKDVKKAVDKVNKLMEDTSTHLQYQVYGKFRDIMVSIVDNDTNKVIKEIPPKSIIDMVEKLCEMAGIFLDKKA